MLLDPQEVGFVLAVVAAGSLVIVWTVLLASWARATLQRAWAVLQMALALAVVAGVLSPAPRQRPLQLH